MFEVITHDHIARIGKLREIFTPAISFVKNGKITITDGKNEYYLDSKEIFYFPDLAPMFRDEIVKKTIEDICKNVPENAVISISYYPNPDVYEALSGIAPKYVLIRNLHIATIRRIIDFFTRLREFIPWDTPIHVVSNIRSDFIPFLVYLGADIIDVSAQLFKIDYGITVKILESFFVDSFLLEITHEKDKKTKKEMLFKWFLSTFSKIRKLIEKGLFRHFIENWSLGNQDTDAFLAIIDNEFQNRLTPYVSMRKPKVNIFISQLSFSRPIITWYYNRLKERYIPPTVKAVIIFPCAARKPYSFSKSHKLFKQAVTSGAGRLAYLIHELMITSPIGTVPRELERTYPCAHYDTTTTGHWSDWEKNHVAKMLDDYFNKISSKPVVLLHVDGGYLEAALTFFEKSRIEYYITGTKGGDVRSDESLRELASKLNEVLSDEEFDKSRYMKRQLEDVRNILAYQFGNKIAKEIVNNAPEIRGSIVKGDIRIGNLFAFDSVFGLFIPLKGGARILSEAKTHLAEIKELPKDNNINAENIEWISDNVESGNYFVCLKDGEPVVSALALFPSNVIKRTRKGIVARIIRRF